MGQQTPGQRAHGRHVSRWRALVYARDHGVCWGCRCDTDALEAAYLGARAAAELAHRARLALVQSCQLFSPGRQARASILSAQLLAGELKGIDSRLRALGFKVGRAFWERHHVEPLVRGGADTLENSATCCCRCHRELSAALVQQLARRPAKRLMVRGVDRQGRAKIYT
jgi:hypothetical protein